MAIDSRTRGERVFLGWRMTLAMHQPAKRQAKAGARETGCELIAALMKESVTRRALSERSGVSLNSVDKWLHEMVRSGLVYRRHAEKEPGSCGRREVIYTLQKSPFDRADWS